MCIATILLIVSLTCVGIFTVIEYAKNKAEEIKVSMVKQAVLDDCLDEENEDYIILIQKCEARASKFKDAEFYMAWVYTEEDGMEVMYVRYENGKTEVFEE
jgi:hypothetical protein